MAKHRAKSSFKKIIMILISLVLISSIILFIKIRWNEHIENRKQIEASKILDTIELPEDDLTSNTSTLDTTERMLKVKELQKENADIVAYLKVNGTNIDYVVVQGNDNDYYLHHNLKKEYSIAGWIFETYQNKFDGTD